jgi:hypothetical protein
MTRTRHSKLTFSHDFSLKGVERQLPAGEYEIVSDEELVEGLSFPVYRRVACWIMAPNSISTTEMLAVEPADLTAAHARDCAVPASPKVAKA